jgi:thiopurine S-methyltransferase
MMDKAFWYEKWEKKQIQFHLDKANAMLVKHFAELSLEPGSRVLVPLCGKSLDIHWLLAQGYKVVGIELSELAIEELFAELAIKPAKTDEDSTLRFQSKDIDILVGDFFEVTKEMVGKVDCIYDRASLIALPQDMRKRYVDHLMKITYQVPQLMISLEYDQVVMLGPPFRVDSQEVRHHYNDAYEVRLLQTYDIPGGIKGVCPGQEKTWLLSPK